MSEKISFNSNVRRMLEYVIRNTDNTADIARKVLEKLDELQKIQMVTC